MATTTEQDRVRELQRALYRAAKADPHGGSRMPAVKNVGEPCAGEPHARFEVAAGGNLRQSALPRGAGASRRPYISLAIAADREYVACSSNPDGRWVAQQARNLVIQFGDEQPFRFLIQRNTSSKAWLNFPSRSWKRGDQGDPYAGPGAERERLRRALDTHAPHRLPRSNPHPRPPPPRECAPHLPPPLQPAQATPRAAAAAAGQPRPNAAERDRSLTPPRPPRRTHPRIRGRLNLRSERRVGSAPLST